MVLKVETFSLCFAASCWCGDEAELRRPCAARREPGNESLPLVALNEKYLEILVFCFVKNGKNRAWGSVALPMPVLFQVRNRLTSSVSK